MNHSERALELKVGLFVLLGLGFIAYMAVHFGRLGEFSGGSYDLTVEFANASGLLKDSNVLLNGAKIGRVATEPAITNTPHALDEATGVIVKLLINSSVRIPANSRFQVGSSGLLGDRFVDVIPPSEPTSAFIEPGSVVAGSRQPGIDDLTREGTDLLADLRKTVDTINSVVVRVDKEILSESNVEDVDKLLSNLRKTTEDISKSGERIEEILTNANRTVLTADEAMASAKLAGEDVRVAMQDARNAMQDARDALAIVRALVEKTSAGQGVVGKMLTDEALAAEIEALVANLRKHGILFYRDSSGFDEHPDNSAPTATSRPAATPRSGNPSRR